MAPEKLLRGEQNRHPELTGTPARGLQESAGNLLGGSGGWRAAGLADLEADKTPHRDVFAEVGNQLVNEFPDGQRFVLDEVLLVQTRFLVKLLHLSGDDLLDHRSRLACRARSEEHTSELQSRGHLVCRLLLEKKNRTHVLLGSIYFS